MRFRMARAFGRVCPAFAVLTALWCTTASAQDARWPGEIPGRATLGVRDESSTQVSQPPVARPEAELEPIPTGPSGSVGALAPAKRPSEPSPVPADEEPLVPIPDPQGAGPVQVGAASFKGVTPGVTTMAEVEKAWGAPKEINKVDNTLTRLYSIETFKRVEVSFYQGKVASIVVHLDHAFPANVVAQQLGLTGIRPVLVSNELGEILGQVYPERSVLFAFSRSEEPGKASMQVAQVILEPIGAEPFVLRAETYLDNQYELSLADLKQALKIEPDNARAHWLQARVLIALGRFDKAVASSGQAVRLDPSNPRYRVTRAQILGQAGELAEAMQEAKQAVEISAKRPHVKARALCLLGDLTASGLRPNYKAAIQYHMEAVKQADPLAVSRHPAVRLAAKRVLIDAHLGAAHDIAWGNWKEKEKAVARWLDRANALAEELIENEGTGEEDQFRVGCRALAACVGMSAALDPSKWTKTVIGIGEELIAGTDDPARKAQYQWNLGMALYDALQIYQMRSEHETALKYGEWAIEYLEQGERQKNTATTGYLLGRLYFRLGAIHAIRDQNHRAAITWFDKAVPLLKKPIPREAFADLGRHGETFVSMGVSYWESGQREKAVELTQVGVGLMEQAVKQGSLPESALAVPYINLATMNRQLGHANEAARFEKMAEKIRGAKLR